VRGLELTWQIATVTSAQQAHGHLADLGHELPRPPRPRRAWPPPGRL